MLAIRAFGGPGLRFAVAVRRMRSRGLGHGRPPGRRSLSCLARTGRLASVNTPDQAPPDRPTAALPASAAPAGRRRLRRAGTGRAVLVLILRPLLAVLVLGVLAGLGLALRLASGPIEVTALVHLLTPLPLGGPARGAAPPDPAGRLDVGRAWIGWDGFRRGAGTPFTLRLADVSIRRAGDGVVDHAARLGVGLDAAALLHGTLAVEGITAFGVRLTLRRDASGLDLGLAPPGREPLGGGAAPILRWDRLRRLTVSDAEVSVHDLLARRDWTLRDIGLDVRPQGGGIVGRLAVSMPLDGRQATLRGSGIARPGGAVSWHLALDPVVPSRLADALPMLVPLRALALPVSLGLDVEFAGGPGRFMDPSQALLSAELGPGTLQAGSALLHVEAGRVRLQASLPDGLRRMATLDLSEAGLRLRAAEDAPGAPPTGPELHAHGRMLLDRLLDPRRIRVTLDADIPRIGFATLAHYWPAEAAGNLRRWITANITAGEATGLHVETRLSGDNGWASLAETDRSGGFDADGLTLWWLRPIPPLVDMRAHLAFQGTDAVLITVPHAVLPVGPPGTSPVLSVSDGRMRIAGLDASHQPATVGLTLSGDLGDLLRELANPRLHLLSAHPVPFTHPSGHTETTVTVGLPLDNDVSIDAVRVEARSVMTGIHLGDVVAGRALDRASLTVSANTSGLSLDGNGLVGAVPARLHYAMDFRAGPPEQLVEQAHVQGRVSDATLRREGLDPSGNVSGSAGLVVDYAARRDGHALVSLGLDMAGLGIATAVWNKPAGIPAEASARIVLLRGRLSAIDALHAEGPGLSVDARAAVSGGRAREVVVGHFAVGRTSGQGRIELPVPAAGRPAGPIRVDASGPVLDLSAVFKGRGGGPAGGSVPARAAGRGAAASAPWIADLSFGRVYVGRTSTFGQVAAHVENDGRRIIQARLDALRPTPVLVRLSAGPDGRRLSGSAGDTGVLLQTLGVTGAIAGGGLQLDGRFDDRLPGAPLSGTVTVGRFVVPDAPLAARIVRNLSIYGWLTAPPAPQLAVDRLVAPFTLRDEVLTLTDARAHSAALGVTMQGGIDLARQRLDLRGTVVPAWAINQLPGRLPLVGRLLSPEKGGGVLAATVSIKGPFAGPDVRVNALAALAPGLLRRLLFE